MKHFHFAVACTAVFLCAPVLAGAANLTVNQDEKTITIRHGDKTVLKYNIAAIPSPDASKPYYARSGHIHPVYSPQGHMVTGDMCPDHVHQHAIWFAWTNAQFEGRKIDFWNSHAQEGRVEHAEVIGTEHSDDEARFQVWLRHLDITGEKPKEVLHEIWDVRVQAVDDVYVIDLESRQTCAGESPLWLKKYHYGAMGLRTPMAWNQPHGGFLTSEGKTRANGNHTRPNWVDSFGPVGDEKAKQQTAGITVMQHPSNFRYPQPVRLHPMFSYFCFAPMVLGDFEIKPGEGYVSRFRYVVHDGPLDKDLTEKLWKQFSSLYPEKRAKAPTLELNVTANGKFKVGGEAVNEVDLIATLKARLNELKQQGREADDVIMIISADPKTPLAHVQHAIQLSQQAGIEAFKLRAAAKE